MAAGVPEVRRAVARGGRALPAGTPAVASVVVGARSPEEVAQSVACFDHPAPEEFWHAVKAAGPLPEHAPTP